MGYWKDLANDLEEDEVFRYSPSRPYNGIEYASGRLNDSKAEIVLTHPDEIGIEAEMEHQALEKLHTGLYDFLIETEVYSTDIGRPIHEMVIRNPDCWEDVRAVSVLEDWNNHVTEMLYGSVLSGE